jgi:hypothetical protein
MMRAASMEWNLVADVLGWKSIGVGS